MIGSGTTLGYATAATGTFTTLAGVTDIKPCDISVDDVDKTTSASVNSAREFEPGLLDAGACEIEMVYTEANMAAIMALVRAERFFKITFTDSSYFSFGGYLNGLTPNAPMAGLITAAAKFKISGLPSFTTA